MRSMIIIATLTLCANTAFGQTVSDFEIKYGKRVKVYSVSEHIWMTPEYAADGQVCMVRLYPKRISDHANYYFTRLPSEELKDVLNQLAPPNSRGAKKYGDFAMSGLGGGIARTTYPFEKITFTFLQSFRIDPATWEQAGKGEEFLLSEEGISSSEKKPTPKVKSGDEFPNASAPEPEIVEIWWKDRKCVGR